MALLDTIPGVARQSAELLLAEVGVEMHRFPVQPICANGLACVRVIMKVQASNRWAKHTE
jgi:hypothetical protein